MQNKRQIDCNLSAYLGGGCPNLGATRPRVGICKSRLEALTCKYMNIGSMLIRVGSG